MEDSEEVRLVLENKEVVLFFICGVEFKYVIFYMYGFFYNLCVCEIEINIIYYFLFVKYYSFFTFLVLCLYDYVLNVL